MTSNVGVVLQKRLWEVEGGGASRARLVMSSDGESPLWQWHQGYVGKAVGLVGVVLMVHCRVKRLWLIHRCSRRLAFHGCVISAISTSLCLGVYRLQERRPVRILHREKKLLTRTLLIGILLGLVILEDGEGRQQAFLSLAIGWHDAHWP